jgi:Iap family predicted aminopeptidase
VCGQEGIFSDEETNYLENELKHHVSALSHDSMGGRPAGTPYETKALNYIISHIDLYDSYVLFIDTFQFINKQQDTVYSHNITILPENTSDSIVLFTAHYDHIAPNSPYSKEILNKNAIHPGADDNASGVALIIELFRLLQKNNTTDQIFGFVFFSGHEEGMFGSRAWIDKYAENLLISEVINFDMVGRLCHDANKIVIRHKHNPAVFSELYKNHNNVNYLHVVFTDEGFQNTDAQKFYDINIPAVTISTGSHQDYHKTTDSVAKINFEGIIKILSFIISSYSQ